MHVQPSVRRLRARGQREGLVDATDGKGRLRIGEVEEVEVVARLAVARLPY